MIPPAPSGWCGSCCWETGCLLPVCDGAGDSAGNTPAWVVFAGSQPEQIVNSLSSHIYITACFRAVARHFSVQGNTLYLAALLLSPRALPSVSTWAGGGSGSESQPQGERLQPTCMAAWLPAPLPSPRHCSPFHLHLETMLREGTASALYKGLLLLPM